MRILCSKQQREALHLVSVISLWWSAELPDHTQIFFLVNTAKKPKHQGSGFTQCNEFTYWLLQVVGHLPLIEDHDRIAVKILVSQSKYPLQRITLVLLKDQELIIKAKCLRSLWFSDFRFMVLSVALTEWENSAKERSEAEENVCPDKLLLFSNS